MKQPRLSSLLILILCLLGKTQLCAADDVIQLWTYYTFPPFTTDIDKREGLSFDFAELLNKELANIDSSKQQVTTRYLPRPRINKYLERGDNAVILWVNPIWFGDSQKEIYQWTPPIIYDRNEVISRIDKKVNYSEPNSLAGLKLGTTLGHKYKNLDALFKSGVITTEEARKEEINIKKLLANRIDVTIMPATGANYLVSKQQLQGKLHFSATPHHEYTRHILVRAKDKNQEKVMMQAIDQAIKSDDWQVLLEKYSLKQTQ